MFTLTPLILLVPLLLQALAILIDEFYFHFKRGLTLWERVSHPIDSFVLFACFAYLYFVPYSPTATLVYVGICLVSGLLITKDEWVHNSECTGAEQWLHSVLFIIHSLVLILN